MLDVWTADRLSGRLTRQGQTAHTFTYFPDAEPDQAVSIRMPTRTTSWESKGSLHPVFDQNLPEGSLRAWFENTVAKALPHYDELELLRITGRSQIGRLRYTPTGKRLLPEDIQDISLDDILRTAGTEDLFDYLMHVYARHSGISGAQPKVMILARGHDNAMAGDTNRLTVKMPTHIVKTWHADYPELALNESLCMRPRLVPGYPVLKRRFPTTENFLSLPVSTGKTMGVSKGLKIAAFLWTSSPGRNIRGVTSRRPRR